MTGEEHMKKLVICSIILAAAFGLSACGTNSGDSSTIKAKAAAAQKQTVKNKTIAISNSEVKNEQSVQPASVNNTTEQPKQQTSTTAEQPALDQAQEAQLDAKYNEWYNMRNGNHTTPGIPSNMVNWLGKYNAVFTGDTSKKIFYFSFDAGGDTGYANQILDVLNKQGIKATFFMTEPYITQNPDITRRIVNEGHAVGNHTVNHLGLPKLSDDQIRQEYQGVEAEFTRVTGKTMLKCVRPPMGAYSEKSLYVTKQLGYKTVFWSIAYNDYDVKNQPTHDQAMAIIKNNYHNGAICLLHIGSKTDADTLDEMISFLKGQGYSFGRLEE